MRRSTFRTATVTECLGLNKKKFFCQHPRIFVNGSTSLARSFVVCTYRFLTLKNIIFPTLHCAFTGAQLKHNFSIKNFSFLSRDRNLSSKNFSCSVLFAKLNLLKNNFCPKNALKNSLNTGYGKNSRDFLNHCI